MFGSKHFMGTTNSFDVCLVTISVILYAASEIFPCVSGFPHNGGTVAPFLFNTSYGVDAYTIDAVVNETVQDTIKEYFGEELSSQTANDGSNATNTGAKVASTRKRKRFGTYVQKINYTCLSQICTYDKTLPNIWSSKKVIVKAISGGNNFTEGNMSDEIEKDGYEYDLQLTPPIITIWVYELGLALSEG